MRITIGGLSGCGKSTIAKMLEQHFGYPMRSVGAFMRELAKEKNMDIDAFEQYMASNPEFQQEIDEKADSKTISFALENPDAILEGRLPGWLCYRKEIPAFKIWLEASLDVRAQRIAKRENTGLEVTKKRVQDRDITLAKRYLALYNIDLNDTSIYNLSINTNSETPESILAIILKALKP